MQDARHAILMTPNAQGWLWEVIDSDGSTAATGVASHQEGAMACAWRAARSFASPAIEAFPDIVFGHAPFHAGGQRSRAQRRRRL
ncbi:MAG: hypothetical protein P4L73_07555 [Caulobacteraceae bacterium]|nr:hypothetical protein [Caulobacteraceae bacterium]